LNGTLNINVTKVSGGGAGPQQKSVPGSDFLSNEDIRAFCEDGEPEQFWLPFDEETKRNATHILVAGMNGSAKSTGMALAIT
ncbi:hypothetical protein KBZ21_41065, partial [Streptomyces sp. A73]|nr:hypothetical protein [Streptomyces sp. A73]